MRVRQSGTTHFTFSDALIARIAQLPNIGSIKIPPVFALERIANLRSQIPETVTLGISGDAIAVDGLNAGCGIWYSVLGGLFPEVALAISRAALTGDMAQARAGRMRWCHFGICLNVTAAACG